MQLPIGLVSISFFNESVQGGCSEQRTQGEEEMSVKAEFRCYMVPPYWLCLPVTNIVTFKNGNITAWISGSSVSLFVPQPWLMSLMGPQWWNDIRLRTGQQSHSLSCVPTHLLNKYLVPFSLSSSSSDSAFREQKMLVKRFWQRSGTVIWEEENNWFSKTALPLWDMLCHKYVKSHANVHIQTVIKALVFVTPK